MRSEQAMYDLILTTARQDDRIRAVILNGSRANPHAPRDRLQDFDIVYIVDDLASFRRDPQWIACFGELLILQMPNEMLGAPPQAEAALVYLMQFQDGNRIDLTLHPLARLDALERDSLTQVLLDKDGCLPPYPPPSERDYLPTPPTARAFAECCNEFWWVAPYVAKGLWREEIIYAKTMLDEIVRAQLMRMLTWHIGAATGFAVNPGKHGKYFRRYLAPELWALLEQTYADADYERTWESLFAICELFRRVALPLAEQFGFAYPRAEDANVSAYLAQLRAQPKTPPA